MVTTVKNESSHSGNVIKNRRLFRSVGAVGLITSFLTLGVAAPALADSTDTLVAKSVEGLREYQIFKHPGADLSYGEEFAPNFKATDIGITVIPEDQTQRKSLYGIAKKIQKEMPEYYDTVIVIEDGKTDTIASYSARPSIEASFSVTLGEEVPDAGAALLDHQEEMFENYVKYGGNADEKLLEAKVMENQSDGSVQKIAPLEESTTPSTVISKSIIGLKSYRVFMHDGAELSESLEVSRRLLEAAAGVVVVKPEHVDGKDLSEIAQFIREGVDDEFSDTVILVVDGENDTFAVSSSLEGVEEKYNEILGKTVDDAGWALLSNAEKLTSERASIIEAQNYNERVEMEGKFMRFGEKVALVVGIILGSVLLVGGLHSVIAKRKKKRDELKNSTEARIARNFENLSEGFHEALVNLDNVADLHDTAIKTKTMSLSEDIRETLDLMQKLFSAVSEKGIPNVRKMEAEVIYASRIEKLVSLLGETYYVDMANDPYAWRSSRKGMKNVKLALEEFQAQILENIQQLNEDRELEFQVALSMLLNRNTVQLDEVYADDSANTRMNSSYERLKAALRNRKFNS